MTETAETEKEETIKTTEGELIVTGETKYHVRLKAIKTRSDHSSVLLKGIRAINIYADDIFIWRENKPTIRIAIVPVEQREQ